MTDTKDSILEKARRESIRKLTPIYVIENDGVEKTTDNPDDVYKSTDKGGRFVAVFCDGESYNFKAGEYLKFFTHSIGRFIASLINSQISRDKKLEGVCQIDEDFAFHKIFDSKDGEGWRANDKVQYTAFSAPATDGRHVIVHVHLLRNKKDEVGVLFLYVP